MALGGMGLMASLLARPAVAEQTPKSEQAKSPSSPGRPPRATEPNPGQFADNWRRGPEGNRLADTGKGTFLNPILAGDRPDPTLLRDGDTYYATFSSFDAHPGLVIWASSDLVNWSPVTSVLREYIGSVWASDLCKHDGKYFIYFPAGGKIFVTHAEKITGPWSDPIDLQIPRIDPCHVVGEDSRRYLFTNEGDRVKLSDDGLSTDGPIEHVYDAWTYPDTWDVEGFFPEGPKLVRHGEFFYMIVAVGGTAGPPTGHMVAVSRSRSVHGPWEHAPNNPVVKTQSAAEKWWNRGHATLFEGPEGQWYLVYHGYENGYRTLGRQMLLEPVRWRDDGWFESAHPDLSTPIPFATKANSAPLTQLSDDFSAARWGTQWSLQGGDRNEFKERVRLGNGGVVLKSKGETPNQTAPLTLITGDLAYGCEIEIERDAGAEAALLLWYNKSLFCGMGIGEGFHSMYRGGTQWKIETYLKWVPPQPKLGRRFFMRLENDHHTVRIHYSPDGQTWTKFFMGFDVSGYHLNVAGDFLSLRPALVALGSGEVVFRNFKYYGL
ncbi:hypothetical protein ABAC402_10820 [Asticcacaulis sp. AC402]|nr:hypothetical protein ABAC402_10820 [Asticcacaulis sp. AC402]